MIIEYLRETYDELCAGFIPEDSTDMYCKISNWAIEIINFNAPLTDVQKQIADLIIRISNVLYNHTSVDVLPLDDGIYDQLVARYNINEGQPMQVGSIPVQFEESPQNEITQIKQMAHCITIKELQTNIYLEDIWKQNSPYDPRRRMLCTKVQQPIEKRLINTKHSYPELVGTLDKCKFVLNKDAIDKGVFNKPSVKVFERDYLQMCMNIGVIQPGEMFEMIAELKYDGVSVEAEVCGDTIISARSRGDTTDDIATDLTPILGGYKFPLAKDVSKEDRFGIKFEAIITKRDLQRMSMIRGKSYKNCRNAIIGLFGSSDAYKFVDCITLIPLATSMDLPRETELKFLNKYYSSGQYNRYVMLRGDYTTILYQVYGFTKSAEVIAKTLPYLIDGVVISFTDPNKIKMLGRTNSINKYSMAIKFNPKKVRTLFIGYTYSIGKTGDVIPMVNFKPCEFIGTIHSKQTAHSYQRFKELDLRYGDEIDVEYVNEVLTYITKPDTEHNRRNLNREPERFITICPFCGQPIQISESGKSAKCVNIYCPERIVMNITDMLKILGFKGFEEETVRILGLVSFKDLIFVSDNTLEKLGPTNARNFREQLHLLFSQPIPDYKFMAALGFSNIGIEKWKKILSVYTIDQLIDTDRSTLKEQLIAIPTIAEATADLICDMLINYEDDIICGLQSLQIVDSINIKRQPKVVITGFRDQAFIDLVNKFGFDCSDSYNITKDCYALITSDKESTSGKMKKAKKYNIPIFTKQEFLNAHNINL